MSSIFTKAFAEAAVLLASHTLAAKTFTAFWNKVAPKLAEGVGYIDRHGDEDLEADKTFLEVITFRDPEITRIVDSCLKEFLHSDVLALLARIERIEDSIRERTEQINAWKLAAIAAPATSLSPLKRTRSALLRRAAREKDAIAVDRKKIEVIKEEYLKRLESDGLKMTSEQLDGLLHSAEGGDLARVMAVAENIRAIEKNLAASLKGSETDADQVKTYTGFLMMCYRVYIEAIERAKKRIENVYLMELAEIIDEADIQMREADKLSRMSAKTIEIAKNNLDLNARTIALAQLYEDHLRARWSALDALKQEMKHNFELARNTFRTVKVGGELIEVVKAGEKDLEAIFTFEPPALAAFYDKELRRDFDALTERIKASGVRK